MTSFEPRRTGSPQGRRQNGVTQQTCTGRTCGCLARMQRGGFWPFASALVIMLPKGEGMQPFISARTLNGIACGVYGVLTASELRSVLEAADLPEEVLSTPRAYVPQRAELRFLKACSRTAGYGNAAELLAPYASIDSYGAFGAYATSAPTFGAALRTICTMMPFHASHDRASVVSGEDGLRFRYHSVLRYAEGYADYATLAVTVVLSITQAYAGPMSPRRIELDLDRPDRPEPFETLFGCPIVYDAPGFAIEFDPEAEHAPLKQRPASLVTLGDVVRDAGGAAPHDLAASVEAILRAFGPAPTNLDTVARSLDLSERTLRRRLDAQGIVFRKLARQVRLDTALELLEETDLDITEIAQRVGYSDPSHFGRAFRESLGVTPSSMRARLSA